MEERKYSSIQLKFDKKRSRVQHCPCGKSNRDGKFVPFEGSDDKGFCFSCGKTFLDGPSRNDRQLPLTLRRLPPLSNKTDPAANEIGEDIFKASLGNYHQNNFVAYLDNLVGKKAAEKATAMYHIGTSKHWPSSTVFWRIDEEGKARSGKIMLYDRIRGKRIKEPFSHITWVHSVLGIDGFELEPTFFGQHLLRQLPSATVCIVESEKTAIICSAYMPSCIWLASGGANQLSRELFDSLKGREVKLYPDLNQYENWTDKARIIRGYANSVAVSDLLEKNATAEERREGLDLADYLILYNISEFSSVAKPNKIEADEILSIPCIVQTGSLFDNVKIVTFRTRDRDYDVLFGPSDEILPPTYDKQILDDLSFHFAFTIRRSNFEGCECLLAVRG